MAFIVTKQSMSIITIPKVLTKHYIYPVHGEKKKKRVTSHLTLPLSLIEPLPRMDIFAPVSSCNLFMELPLGPSSFPTKLNCNKERKGNTVGLSHCLLPRWLPQLPHSQ